MLNKMCKKSLAIAAALSLVTAVHPMQAFAAEDSARRANYLSVSTRLKEPTTLRPETEYGALEVNELLDTNIIVNGEKDPSATYYVLEKSVFDSLEDKSEESVRNSAGFTTGELDGNSDIKDVVLVTYHTFCTEKPIEVDTPEGESDGRDTVPTEKIEDTMMATKEYSFVVTRSANEIADYFKAGIWYKSHENNVTWLYALNEDGLIDHLYTESTNLSRYIVDGVFYIPETIEDIPVLKIGSGSEKPFIPQDVYFNSVVIPSTVQVIGDYAFYQNKNAFELTAPATLTKIGKKAFYSSNVTALRANAPYIEIEDMAFANCHNLESVALFGDYDIGYKSFDGGQYGSALTSVFLSGRGKLGNLAFSNNNMLRQVIGQDGATETKEDTFKGCPFDISDSE